MTLLSFKVVLSRYQTQKHKLIEQGLGVHRSTEDNIMYNIEYYKIYDSDNIKNVIDKVSVKIWKVMN